MNTSVPPQLPPAQPRLHLLYHELRPVPAKYSYVVAVPDFDQHMQLVARIRASASSILWPEVTFDDGHLSNFEHALPILESHHLIARFFITVGWPGQKPGYMDWPQIRSLHQAGQAIGAHGWTHTLLTHCAARDLELELVTARHTLEDKLGAPVTTMSLPGGRSNPRVLAACQAAGYTQVFTSVPKPEPFPLGPLVGRLNVRGDMDLPWIAGLFERGSTTLAGLERRDGRKAIVKALLGDRLYASIWSLLNREESETVPGDASANENTPPHQ